MRIGLCFECQRTLNENRRSDKKRPAQRICGGHNHDIDSQTEDSSVLKAIGPLVHKKTKIVSSNDKMVSLPHEAFIATGEGIKSWSEGYGFREIGLDLVGWVNEAAHETGQLIQATMPTNNPLPSQMYHPLATTADTTGTRSTMEDFSPSISSSENHDGIAPAASTIESNIAGRQNEIGATISPNEEVDTIYHKSLQSLQNSIFLLTQWKLSWDGTLQATAAIAGSDVPSGSETDPSSLLLNDAVASAAAVVAASMTPTPSVAAAAMALSSANVTSDWPDTLASLLLAADQSNDNDIALTTHHDRVVDWNMQPAQNERAVEDDPDDVSDGVGEFPYD